MKIIYIVANWKSNKTQKESEEWFDVFKKEYIQDSLKEVVICPVFTDIPFLFSKNTDKNKKISIGAQNVSSFEEGPFTGEISASQLKDFCSFCIVGHSERRINFSEDASMINDKIERLVREKITPIVCISSLDQLEEMTKSINGGIIAYEPLSAIGSGIPQDPKDAESIAKEIKSKFDVKVLYGGSVDEENVSAFTSIPAIDGALVGGASLDPIKFKEIVLHA